MTWRKNIIKDVRNLFKLENLQKEITDAAIKDIKNSLYIRKRKKATKMKKLEKKQLRIYYLEILEIFLRKKKKKTCKISSFSSNNYAEYEGNSDRKETLSVEECLIKIRPYFKGIINNLKNSGTWKIQLIIAINFISSIDNDEEWVMHWRSDNIETMMTYEADKVIKELFDSLKNRYQNNSKQWKVLILDHI